MDLCKIKCRIPEKYIKWFSARRWTGSKVWPRVGQWWSVFCNRCPIFIVREPLTSLNWCIIDLQLYVSFLCIAKWFSFICIFFFRFFSIIGYYNMVNIVPCAIPGPLNSSWALGWLAGIKTTFVSFPCKWAWPRDCLWAISGSHVKLWEVCFCFHFLRSFFEI